MAFVPGYSTDIFISYAHRDDQDDWVTRLKDKFAAKLSELGPDAEVWFDANRLRTGDVFKEAIRDKLSNAMMLVAVVSPNYVNSQFCIEEELEYFIEKFGREVIQLVKIPLLEGQDPPVPELQHEKLFDEKGVLSGKALDSRLSKVFTDVRAKMVHARSACSKVYLAQPKSPQLRPGAQDLKRALHQANFAILPNALFLQRTLDSRARQSLEEADAAVLINSPDEWLQRQLAIAKETGKPLIELDAFPPPGETYEMVDEVRRKVAASKPRGEVYFVYDYFSDGERARKLYPQIEALTGRKIVLPQSSETYQKAKLLESDGIVLFRELAPDKWYDAQTEMLLQAAALRHKRPAPEAWYSICSGTPCFSRVPEPPSRWRIQRTGPLDLADLQPFLDALPPRASAGAAS